MSQHPLEMELRPILDTLTARPPLDLALGEDAEHRLRLPPDAAGLESTLEHPRFV